MEYRRSERRTFRMLMHALLSSHYLKVPAYLKVLRGIILVLTVAAPVSESAALNQTYNTTASPLIGTGYNPTWIFDESTLPGVKLSDACANYATKTHSQLTEPLHIVSIIGVIAGMYLFVVVSLGKVYSRYRQQRLASCLTVAGFVAIPALAVLLSYALTLLVKWHKVY